ncbi:MAG TPA: beta-galactosidase BgaS [Fervidobacterium sp.]|nr:beta-galactosidase BgaS [Fervidobacterium sp.]HRB91417.1 beta-galactosidase BgaS [Fervidobacterium sp.]
MFPENFMFGASMSGFQFEMGNPSSTEEIDPNSDWFVWVRESENLVNGIVSGDMPENGAWYWKQYDKVHSLAVDFGMDVLRIGIEWSRIFPTSTKHIPIDSPNLLEELDKIANKSAVAHYRKIMEDMKTKGLKVFVNLYHFSLPLWLHDPIAVHRGKQTDKMGWISDDIPIEFAKFAEYMAWKYCDIVDIWASMNEPHVVSQLGYFITSAGFPPAYFDPEWYMKSLKNEATAHNLAYDAIKKYTTNPVGIIYAFAWVDTVSPAHRDIFEDAMEMSNWRFMDMIKDKIDYIGVNYYSRMMIDRLPMPVKIGPFEMRWNSLKGYGQSCVEGGIALSGRPASDSGWEIYPEGLYKLLKAVSQRYKGIPLLVTENGISDEKDKYRPFYIISHLYAVEKAIEDGVDVRGYLHWSIIDNYEWPKGYTKRFGLAYTDFEKKAYVPRPSMYIFKEISEKRTTKHLIGYDPYNLINF